MSQRSVPVLGRGPGFRLFTAWGQGGRITDVYAGTALPAVARLRRPPLERVAFIRAASWEEAVEFARKEAARVPA